MGKMPEFADNKSVFRHLVQNEDNLLDNNIEKIL